jgi:hypothetical protein
MENINNISNEILSNGNYKIILLNGVKLLVFESGTIYRFSFGKMKLVNNLSDNDGYNRFGINGKNIFRHRIMAYTWLDFDINNSKLQIDHIDGDRINNHISNLRVVNHQQNQWNQTKAKGYSWDKKANKFKSCIRLNNKTINLGRFDNEEDAREAYLNAKKLYHNI